MAELGNQVLYTSVHHGMSPSLKRKTKRNHREWLLERNPEKKSKIGVY